MPRKRDRTSYSSWAGRQALERAKGMALGDKTAPLKHAKRGPQRYELSALAVIATLQTSTANDRQPLLRVAPANWEEYRFTADEALATVGGFRSLLKHIQKGLRVLGMPAGDLEEFIAGLQPSRHPQSSDPVVKPTTLAKPPLSTAAARTPTNSIPRNSTPTRLE